MNTFNTITGIYALSDPRSSRIMYVGQAVDIDFRFRQHCKYSHNDRNMQKVAWINDLKKNGLVPKLIVLEQCDWADLDTNEQRYIREFKAKGQAELNIKSGAGGGTAKVLNAHQEDWFQLGKKLKEADLLISEITTEIGRLAGVKQMDIAIKLRTQLSRTRSKLEEVMIDRFPEWTNFARYFYGQDEP